MNEVTNLVKFTIEKYAEEKNVAIAFSGGLDSGLISALAKNSASSVNLYTVGIEDSYDVQHASELSKELDLEWSHILLDEDLLINSLKNAIKATNCVDPITLSFEIPLVVISSKIEEKYILTGQGADELFCGYSKYVGLNEKELKIQRMKDYDVLKSITLPFESKISELYDKTIFYPYLDESLVSLISTFPISDLIPTEDERKRMLRDVAIDLGYSNIAAKKKKAAQYGSGAMKLIRDMAKKEKLSVSEFIISLQ